MQSLNLLHSKRGGREGGLLPLKNLHGKIKVAKLLVSRLFKNGNFEETVLRFEKNKARYTATEVAGGWAGAIFEVTTPFRQEQ